jgi:hypothetical protein
MKMRWRYQGEIMKRREYAKMSFGPLAFIFLLQCCFAHAESFTPQLQVDFALGEKLSQTDTKALVEYGLEGVHPMALREYLPNEVLPARGFGITLNRMAFGKELPVLELRLPEDYYFLGLKFNRTKLTRNAPREVQEFEPATFNGRDRIFLVQLKEEDFVEDKNNDESLLHIEIAGKDIKNRRTRDYSCYVRAFLRVGRDIDESKLAKRK